MRSFSVSAFAILLYLLAANIASATQRLECTVTSPMKDDVGQGGYDFSLYSNLATLGNDMCLQHIVRNHPGNTATKVEWFEDTPNGKNQIINVRKLPGCYGDFTGRDCNCDTIPCQIAREFYSEKFEIRHILSTVNFGVTTKQYSSNNVRARNTGTIDFPEHTDDSSNDDTAPKRSPAVGNRTEYALLDQTMDTYPPMAVRLSGFPATSHGETMSLDLYFTSVAYSSGQQFIIENSIRRETGFENFFLAPIELARSGGFELANDAASISWSAFEEPYSDNAFKAWGKDLVPLSEAGVHKHPVNKIGIKQNAEIVIYYQGEIVLETQAPAYVGIE